MISCLIWKLTYTDINFIKAISGNPASPLKRKVDLLKLKRMPVKIQRSMSCKTKFKHVSTCQHVT